MAAVRSTDEYDSQLLAEETRRLETSAPRRCASLPTTYFGSASHGQCSRAGREIALARGCRGTTAAAASARDFVRVHELRDGRQLNGGRSRVRDHSGKRQGAVRGAEIDADASTAAKRYSTSISAGASTARSCREFSLGSETASARQPLCRSMPAGGLPEAGTLPMYFT